MYPTMPHMENPSCYRVESPSLTKELYDVPAFSTYPDSPKFGINCRLQGADMVDSFSSTAKPRSFVVIPARYASTRLPRKMLLRQTGKTVLQHTYEAACAARKPSGVIIATDHAEIAR